MSGVAPARVAQSTYDAAHAHFDAAPLRFWDRYGSRTVARLSLRPGARVLDVCSGTGASALPCARAVGPSGSVIAVDVSKSLLDIARHKAERERLHNVRFLEADMAKLDFAEASFDAVVIVFGIFFAPDMAAQVRALSRLLRPGGVLAVTAWGPRLFEPLYSSFLESVRAHRSWTEEYRPWDRLTTPDQVSQLMSAAEALDVEITLESGTETLARPDDWWTIVLGTGLRWFVDQLDPWSVDEVRCESLARARVVRAVETNVIYGVARK
jgi:ubiquinone/menaquinone biosynthesis C-methylase UbiE